MYASTADSAIKKLRSYLDTVVIPFNTHIDYSDVFYYVTIHPTHHEMRRYCANYVVRQDKNYDTIKENFVCIDGINYNKTQYELFS